MDNNERNDLIQEIEGMFPADAPYPDTQKIGQELLLKAISNSWRQLPDHILKEYARLCQKEDYERSQ